MNNDLISREALKKALSDKNLITWTHEYGDAIPFEWIMSVIDNAPTVETYTEEDIKQTIKENFDIGYEMAKAKFERPQGNCKSCRHRDPEDKKCDCGGQERQGCSFPVRDNYFCKFYEKGGAE